MSKEGIFTSLIKLQYSYKIFDEGREMKKVVFVIVFVLAFQCWSFDLSQLESTSAQDQIDIEVLDLKYATAFLDSSVYVHDSEEAIGEPDGEFAKIEYWGWLDLEIRVKNGEGDDIAIYAKRSEGGVSDYRFHHYLVIVKLADEWRIIGIGGGVTSPEKFDLKDVQRVDMLRILYRNRHEIRQMSRSLQHYPPGGYTMGIDAVEALH
jgi:hypothetical protein